MYIVCGQRTMMPHPTLRIDLDSPVPVYRQIADALRAVLVAGDVKSGENLPTIRELALDLGIHKNTVAEAYRVLADEGWLELRRRHGARVLPRVVPDGGEEAVRRFSRRLREVLAEALAAGVGIDAAEKALEGSLKDLRGGSEESEG